MNFRIRLTLLRLSRQHFSFIRAAVISLAFTLQLHSLNSFFSVSVLNPPTLFFVFVISMWVSSHKNKPVNQNSLLFSFTSSCHFSSVICKEKAGVFLAFWGKLKISSDLITRTWHPPHRWVTGVSGKHISHVLKTFQLTSTVDQCHHDETQACWVTGRFSPSPTQSYGRMAPM